MRSRSSPKSKKRNSKEEQLEGLLQLAASLQAAPSVASISKPVAVPVPEEKPLPGGPKKSPVRDEIALRAYQIFLQRGAIHGLDWADWFQAEVELRAAQPKRRYSQSRS